MSEHPTIGGPVQNTDRELWREREGDYYADSIHVTEGGGIGIDCGGYVVVMPLRKWHALACPERASSLAPVASDPRIAQTEGPFPGPTTTGAGQ
jgi:hypothetical protein